MINNLEKQKDQLKWFQIDNNCFKECGRKGGFCSTCMNYDSLAISGYCCSGVNHFDGKGPIFNGNCPSDAIAVQKSNVHSCVISRKQGRQDLLNFLVADYFDYEIKNL